MTSELLGLKKGEVRLVDHNEKWVGLFLKEKKLLQNNLKDKAVVVEHAGSTAISGIKAKPIIDIWVGARLIKDFEKIIPALEKSKYSKIRTTKAPKFHFVFAKGNSKVGTTHYLHLVKYKGKIWCDILKFRDILNGNTNLAKRYEDLKLKLAKKYADKRFLYIKGKDAFVKKALEG